MSKSSVFDQKVKVLALLDICSSKYTDLYERVQDLSESSDSIKGEDSIAARHLHTKIASIIQMGTGSVEKFKFDQKVRIPSPIGTCSSKLH